MMERQREEVTCSCAAGWRDEGNKQKEEGDKWKDNVTKRTKDRRMNINNKWWIFSGRE